MPTTTVKHATFIAEISHDEDGYKAQIEIEGSGAEEAREAIGLQTPFLILRRGQTVGDRADAMFLAGALAKAFSGVEIDWGFETKPLAPLEDAVI